MSTSQSPPRTTRRRILAACAVPLASGLFLGIGLGVWAMPVRIERIARDARGAAHIVTAWDTSRWQALRAVWWQALALFVLSMTLSGIAWQCRAWLLARASAARFFAASLIVHSLLLMSLWAVPLSRAVVEHAEVIRVHQAAELFEEKDLQPAQPGHPAGQAAFEKMPDPPPEAALTPVAPRQAPALIPVPDDAPAPAPTIPMQAVRALPPQRVLIVPLRHTEPDRQPTQIERQSAASFLKPVEIKLDMPELPPAEDAPREKPVEDRSVVQVRRDVKAPVPSGPEPLRLPKLKQPRPADLRPEARDLPRLAESEQAGAPVGRQQPRRLALAAPPEPEMKLKAEAAPSDRPGLDARAMLPKLAAPAPLPVPVPDKEMAPLPPPPRPPARPAIPSPWPADLSPNVDRVAISLPRSPARLDREATVEEKVPAQATLLLRQKEVRQHSLELYGGTPASEEAVERGLDWLAAHQSPGGNWSLNNFHANCKHPHCPDLGTVTSDPAGTGVALLPFLGAGHTHQGGKHQKTVARALRWLVEQQRVDGSWLAPGDARPMYGHGIASIALCEAYGMTGDRKLRGPAQKALDYIIKAQHEATGGWRYQPNQPADTSVVGWQLMALKSGEMAGLSVPPKVFEGVKRWLASVEGNRPVGGQFGYQSPTPAPAMTAQGLLCLQYLGARRDEPRMRAGTAYLLQHLPRPDGDTSYYWYHANQVMYHVQGEPWKAWNGKLRDLLVSTQEKQGPVAGSWKPSDRREQPGGRLYATSLRLLMLEVYYRHLPLYQQLER
jgi:hypothetical protein